MISDIKYQERSGSFVENMSLPVHRWFRFSAGFSAKWAEDLIKSKHNSNTMVLDPFAGSGTSLLAADAVGVVSVGIEAQPFIARVTSAKLNYSIPPDSLFKKAEQVLVGADHLLDAHSRDLQYPSIIRKC